jgi:hypothetical protein
MKSALFYLMLTGCCCLASCQQQQDNANVTVDTLETTLPAGTDNQVDTTLITDSAKLTITPALTSQHSASIGAATFQALLPCDGCDGIRTRMILNYDSSSFFLRQVYLGRIDPDTLRLRSGKFVRIMGPEKTTILRFEAAKEAPPFFMKELGDSALIFLNKDGSDQGQSRRTVLKKIMTRP